MQTDRRRAASGLFLAAIAATVACLTITKHDVMTTHDDHALEHTV